VNAVLARALPAWRHLRRYSRADFGGDAVAGLVVAIMVVPQGMAYATLAGLPPQVGLYASIAPLVAYALFGTSRALAVGPVAVLSLMTATSLAGLAEPGTAAYGEAALILALLGGLLLLALGVLRLGFVVNFLSHSVLAGFISASAILIALGQVKVLLGIEMPRADTFFDAARQLAVHLGGFNAATALVGLASVAVLLLARKPLARWLAARGVRPGIAEPLTKMGPLLAVVLGIAAVVAFDLGGAGVKLVGDIPAGLPPLAFPHFDAELWRALLGGAALIALVGYVESVSVAKALASKKRERVDPDQELIGLGAANIAAGLTGGYPVTGGFARSLVNFAAGARTPFAAVITAALTAATVATVAAAFRYLPHAVLAAVIVVAVLPLVDLAALRRAWRYDKADAATLAATFAGVLAVGIELGIAIGAALSLAIHLYRTSRPHIAVVGRVGASEHFRNVERHQVETLPHVLAIRVDESLYFPNTADLEDRILAMVAERRELRHVVLIASAVNSIDASALETLEALIAHLRDGGVTLHLAEVKGPVMDKLRRSDLLEKLAPGRVFLSTHEAMLALAARKPETAALAPAA
jgi:SulP family sulfate permease